VRFSSLAFGGPNPLVDPGVVRRDTLWTEGVLFTAPITSWFGFVGNIEFAHNSSNLPNYRTQDFSVSLGPIAKF
jgi:hypothetical protein